MNADTEIQNTEIPIDPTWLHGYEATVRRIIVDGVTKARRTFMRDAEDHFRAVRMLGPRVSNWLCEARLAGRCDALLNVVQAMCDERGWLRPKWRL